MAQLSPEQISELRQRLDQQERALHEDIRRERDNQDDYRQLAGDVPDPGDHANADLMVDLGHAEVGRDVAELREIDAARKRMEDGEYGFCTQCGGDIPFARLQVHPTAVRCTPCQALREKTFADQGRGATL